MRGPIISEVRDAIAAVGPEIVALTQALIRARSPSPPGDERAVSEVVARFLAKLPDVEMQRLSRSTRRPNLVFSVGRRDLRSLLMSAHLDTVSPGVGWTVDPFSGVMRDGRIYGLGATDNKGAVAAMAGAYRALVELGVGDHGRLIFVANADEERGGAFGMAHVAPLLDPPPDAAVVAEPSGVLASFERLWTGARGTSRFCITVTGREGHSALASHSGANAIETLGAVMASFRASVLSSLAGNATTDSRVELVPVRVEGGTGWGVLPAHASAAYDLRIVPELDQTEVEAALRKAISIVSDEHHVAVTIEYDSNERWISPSSVDAAERLLEAAELAWTEAVGSPPSRGCFPGGTDARFLSARGIPTLPALGPGALMRAHAADEYVGVDEVLLAAQIYGLLAVQFLLRHNC
jgi:succinyl-diaminopimelate desuccinylase